MDLERALKRAVAMIIGRLRAYGGRWKEWVSVGEGQRVLSAQSHANTEDKQVLQQDGEGNYTIDDAIWALAQKLGMTT